MTPWPDDQLMRLLPPQTRDARGFGFAAMLNGLMAHSALGNFFVRNAETCPPAALKGLIAEYSLEEFIAPGMPEAVVRKIIKHAWLLHEAKGYDAGVRLGLSLLGMRSQIDHWHQTVPIGAPNTNRITVYSGQQLFANEQTILGREEVNAALHMIDATKRWSQESIVAVGTLLRQPAIVVAGRCSGIAITKAKMTVIQPLQARSARITIAARMTVQSITRIRSYV